MTRTNSPDFQLPRGTKSEEPGGPAAELLRSAPALTTATLWSMIEADTESVMFLAEGGGEVPLFAPEEATDDAGDPGPERELPSEDAEQNSR
jgi:hypothetical protein